MKKRLIPLLLLWSLLLTTPVLAVPDSAGNFVRSRTYDGRFSDLAADSPFYDNVAALYEYGLSQGRADGTYGLQAPMTRGEIFIFAGRIRSIYRTGSPEEGPGAYEGTPLAAKYLAYLTAEQVVGGEVSARPDDMSLPATRAEVAHVLARVLPDLPLINDRAVTEGYASGEYLADVTEQTPYREDILLLYRTGISAGSDERGTFYPDSPITRGAAAAMLTRLADPALRVHLRWETANARRTTLAGLIRPGTYIASPATGAELDESVRFMLASGSNHLTLQYGGLSAVQARKVMGDALAIVKTYCEQGYSSVTCTYTSQGEITMTFTASQMTEQETAACREATLSAAMAVRDRLWEDGLLTEDMTETEKAKVYFAWICENCVYDAAGDRSVSHIPYGLFENGAAVCDGYTGAYNLFLKLEGISCMALANEQHIWTVAELDGKLVHIDTTWGDAGNNPNYYYFAMTPESSWREHAW